MRIGMKFYKIHVQNEPNGVIVRFNKSCLDFPLQPKYTASMICYDTCFK